MKIESDSTMRGGSHDRWHRPNPAVAAAWPHRPRPDRTAPGLTRQGSSRALGGPYRRSRRSEGVRRAWSDPVAPADPLSSAESADGPVGPTLRSRQKW